MKTAPPPTARVTRQDIEAKLRQLRGDVDTAGEAAKGIGTIAAGVAVVVVIAIAYFVGKKRGKRKSTVVEVRRF
ncbi:MAG: hypothetical protein M3144_06630 [Actinomycetota bacterium]|nr:hypothetical protein [Actinomycetota bacterium]